MRRIALVLWIVALVGYFGPWIGLRPAALAWNAYDLFTLMRLLPEIETGALAVNLQTLRLPLVGLAVLLPLRFSGDRGYGRWVVALGGVALAFAALPTYPQILTAWRTPGWNATFWWGIAGMALALGCGAAARLGPYRVWIAAVWAALTGLPAALTLVRLLPALARLHAAPVHPGWGYWLWMVGMAGSAALALIEGIQALRRRNVVEAGGRHD